jgi:hypothetical protein
MLTDSELSKYNPAHKVEPIPVILTKDADLVALVPGTDSYD